MAWGYGLKTRRDPVLGIVVTDIDAGEHLLVRGVDFGTRGARSLTVSVLAERKGGIEVRLDSPDGPLCGTLILNPGHGWTQRKCRLEGARGIHDLYFVFSSGGFEWDWWKIQ